MEIRKRVLIFAEVIGGVMALFVRVALGGSGENFPTAGVVRRASHSERPIPSDIVDLVAGDS